MRRLWPIVLTVLAFTGVLRAQDTWQKIYDDAERAFEQREYVQAQQLFLRAMRQPLAPTARGINVPRVSQIRGVIPEYYLAVIADNDGRLDEAYAYAQTVTTTRDYFRPGDSRLKAMEAIIARWTAANPTATRGLGLPPALPITPVVVGPYYALVIGIDDYSELPKLHTAVADAKAVAEVLTTDFGFQTRVLLNATRDEISRAFNEYRRTLTEKDNFLIYYAGHGYLDQKADRAYWLPVNAEKDDTTHWMIADDITSTIQRTAARHVLLVSDSCYAGGLTRDIGTLEAAKRDRSNYLRKMIQGPSRSLLASGGLEPVSDGGGDGHSVFASALLFHLRKPRDDSAFAASGLFEEVKQTVAGRSGQVPVYQQIRKASLEVGEVGDFVFLRQLPAGKQLH